MPLTKTTRPPARTLSALLLLAAFAAAAAPHASAQERAVVTKRRVVIVRTGELARQFPGRRRAVVNLPVVGGLSDPKVLRKVRAALDLKN
ncbi:MAG TPA: hypothetical protein VF654_04265, partial [Pyrinomonadaceae bacterium]